MMTSSSFERSNNRWVRAIVWLLLFPIVTFAQGVYNQTTVFVNGASVHVDGEVQSNGSLVNDGYVGFTGNWSCPGDYSGTGVLSARGEGRQRVAHFDHQVADFVIDGHGLKTIDGKMTVSRELVLKTGIVEVSTRSELSLAKTAHASGGAPESYVTGALTAEGLGRHFFPIGKNGKYLPVTFLNVKGNNPRYSLEVFENAPPTASGTVADENGLYIERRDISGTFRGSRISVLCNPALLPDLQKIAMLGASNWDGPFNMIPLSREAGDEPTFTTIPEVTAPIILFGGVAQHRLDGAFYFSTALSINASRPENRAVKVFGKRLSADHFHFTVFDRRGAIVFESHSLEGMMNNGWDGRSLKGDALVPGTYPYQLTASRSDGQSIKKTGMITIVY